LSIDDLTQDLFIEDHTAESLSGMISGISEIGHACTVLSQAGLEVKIMANKISINQDFVAQLLSSNGHSWWVVFALDGSGPIWTVGAQPVPQNSWVGAE
jgi:hypothetical protein